MIKSREQDFHDKSFFFYGLASIKAWKALILKKGPKGWKKQVQTVWFDQLQDFCYFNFSNQMHLEGFNSDVCI